MSIKFIRIQNLIWIWEKEMLKSEIFEEQVVQEIIGELTCLTRFVGSYLKKQFSNLDFNLRVKMQMQMFSHPFWKVLAFSR